MPKYKVIVIERLELEAIVEAPNAKAAAKMGRQHEFVDERTALNLPTQVSKVEKLQSRETTMKLIYGISRWTNANSNKRTHIPNATGQPICGKSTNPYRQHTYETCEGDLPTCQKCLKIMRSKEVQND